MGLEHTSVPRWPGRPPPVDPAGRSVTILAFGPPAHPVAAAWAAQAGGRARVLLRPAPDEGVEAAVHGAAAGATVGWRLMLAGPEEDVLRARAAALRLGAVPGEIGVHVTDTGRRRVWCAHCRTVTAARVPVGGTVPCASCGRTLHVYHHVSRPKAAYLGYQADAEES
jgi:hypothetical protein